MRVITPNLLLKCPAIKIYNIEDLPQEHVTNIVELAEVLNKIQNDFGKEFVFTSVYRDEEHIRKAKEQGIKMASKGMHTIGCAVDISDPSHELHHWFTANKEEKLIEYNVWTEVLDTVKRCHIQTKPYGSWIDGKTRQFNP